MFWLAAHAEEDVELLARARDRSNSMYQLKATAGMCEHLWSRFTDCEKHFTDKRPLSHEI